jgi:hypothetical protein
MGEMDFPSKVVDYRPIDGPLSLWLALAWCSASCQGVVRIRRIRAGSAPAFEIF